MSKRKKVDLTSESDDGTAPVSAVCIDGYHWIGSAPKIILNKNNKLGTTKPLRRAMAKDAETYKDLIAYHYKDDMSFDEVCCVKCQEVLQCKDSKIRNFKSHLNRKHPENVWGIASTHCCQNLLMPQPSINTLLKCSRM